MNTFPVISSIISPVAIASFVSNKYRLSEGTTCRLLKTGINHTYRIDDGSDSFIFRIYSFNWRTKEEINEEIKLLNLLRENKISVSYPIEDNDKEYIQEIEAPEGKRFAVLFSFAPGNKILNFSSETHFEIGKQLAAIHKLTKNLRQKRITYDSEILLNKSLEHIRRFLPNDTKEMEFLVNTKSLLEQEITNAQITSIRQGIVHLDVWFDNFNVSENNTITLFDFDFCGNGWLCLDIAYYVMQVYSTEKIETERKQKLKSFFQGYDSIEVITNEEKRLLPTLGVCLYYFYLGVQCSRFDNWSNTFINEVYMKRFVDVLIKGYYEMTKNGIQLD
ncbi:MAG: phosphotransferase [Chitinophagaceae bacterium]